MDDSRGDSHAGASGSYRLDDVIVCSPNVRRSNHGPEWIFCLRGSVRRPVPVRASGARGLHRSARWGAPRSPRGVRRGQPTRTKPGPLPPAGAPAQRAGSTRSSKSARPSRAPARSWSSWTDADAALREVDALIATVDADRLPNRLTIRVLFAATGPIQEVSLSSGWAYEFLALAERFDRAEERAFDQGSWRRLLNRRVTPV